MLKRRIFLGSLLYSGASFALGRTPLGGALRLQIPWGISSVDPHELHDIGATFFAAALCDPLYASDTQGRIYPALAEGLPTQHGEGAELSLRPGLLTAQGRPLTVTDAVWSINRARTRSAKALLAEFSAPSVRDGKVYFAKAKAQPLAQALASHACAILPQGYSPEKPDGSGAFSASLSPERFLLKRSPRAARGAAFLEQIEVKTTSSISEGLRAFEVGHSDIGWLGDGLHRRRPNVVAFNGPELGWLVLRTGKLAGNWSAPGVAQSLVGNLPPTSLTRFGLDRPAAQATRWGGGDAELLVDAGSPYLAEVGEALAQSLSQPGNVVSTRKLTRTRLSELRSSGQYNLMLDVVRSLGQSKELTHLALTTAANPALASRPPHLPNASPAQLARTLPLGVLGALRVHGYAPSEWRELASWDLGRIYRVAPRA